MANRKALLIVLAALLFCSGTIFGAKLAEAPVLSLPPGLANLHKMQQLIQKHHVGDPVTDDKLYHDAARGMVQGLSDPHTHFRDPKETRKSDEDSSGEFGGIGAILKRSEQKEPLINRVVPDSPAAKAGLKPLDVIVSVNGTVVAGKELSDVVELIRGPVGSEAVLHLRRAGKELTVTIVRRIIESPSVTDEVIESGGKRLWHVSISDFNANTGEQFERLMTAALETRPDAIILDVRMNGGGYTREAGKVICNWYAGKPYISFVNKSGASVSDDCKGDTPLSGIPTVVLVDKYSVSSAEVTAGALQDFGNVTVMGTQSYGKGVGQRKHNLPDGSQLMLVEFGWHTPKGRSINKIGITPDVVVERSDADIKAGRDPQLEAAVKRLTEAPAPAP